MLAAAESAIKLVLAEMAGESLGDGIAVDMRTIESPLSISEVVT
jgi:hypothetical protein